MKIQAEFVSSPASKAIFGLLADAGHRAYYVGGCVRNAIIGAPVSDIDITTPATPEEVARICRDGGLKVIPTGIEHGTVTVISEGVAHEVTTFRRDVQTDGRRAVVAFSTDIAEDARRRDFTMNALYADVDGAVIDPLFGLNDLLSRRVRFILDAQSRIREDYLRSLRFFRFHAWYGDPADGLDPEAMAAIADNLDGLDQLSAERVGSEVLKLLSAPDPAPALAAMEMTGVLSRILPGANPQTVTRLVHLEGAMPADPIRRLAALGGDEADVRLRLSRVQARELDNLRTHISTSQGAGELGYRLGQDSAINVILLRHATFGTPVEAGQLASATNGASQSFPVSAADLMPSLVGVDLGNRLKELEKMWIASNFSLTRGELLAR